jgi:mannosyl-oligosaccharide glucosidase
MSFHFILIATIIVVSLSCHTVHRPNLYIGTKSCSPKPISTGIMWFSRGDASKMRHTAEMSDNLKKWGWTAHDGEHFGHHALLDPKAKIHLTTDYIADESSNSWTMRLSGNLTNKGKKTKKMDERNDVSVIFYVTNADSSGEIKLQSKATPQGPSSFITGRDEKNGRFSFQVVRTKSDRLYSKRHVVTHSQSSNDRKTSGFSSISSSQVHSAQLRRTSDVLWKAKDLLLPIWQKSNRIASNTIEQEREEEAEEEEEEKNEQKKSKEIQDPFFLPLLMNTTDESPNLIALQYTLAAPFELVIVYEEHDDKENVPEANEIIDTSIINQKIISATKLFENKFEKTFHLLEKGYDDKQIQFAKAAFSNLIGSITYFYGSSSVKSFQPNHPPSKTKDGPLITGVPSRSFFPRGFLWDEGFHQLLVSSWNPSLSRVVVRHWLSRMDPNGWIPREQILGPEAVSKVPEQFRLQSPEIANPPAMLLTIENMLYPLEHLDEYIEVNDDGSTTTTFDATERQNTLLFLKEIYPKFLLHYKWLKKSQSGQIKGTFRWRGQTSTHCLASGLDDYPRAKYFTSEEKHVDLLSWMIYAAKILKRLSNQLNLNNDNANKDNKYVEDAILFDNDVKVYEKSLNNHWNDNDGIWYDIGVDNVDQVDPKTGRILRFGQPKQIKHYGYVGLFPFLLQIIQIDDTNKLLKVINNLYEPHLLWSNYGLRSLSRLDEYFGEGENYWRGKIWLNINYLALRSLKYYSIHSTSNDVRQLSVKIHHKLKKNLVDNLYKQYRRSGFVWENYSPKNGKGKGCFPFSGWSSLIVSIMADKYR